MRVLPRCGAAEATLGVVGTGDGNERPAAGPERGPLLPLERARPPGHTARRGTSAPHTASVVSREYIHIYPYA